MSFAPGSSSQATGTLSNGVLKISGKTSTHESVSGQGTLSVQLSGTAAAPTLTVSETGLTTLEQKLGMTSPFIVNGEPLTVPIQMTPKVAGCPAA